MPALGHTIQEDFIRGEWEQAERDGHDAMQTFRQEYLNQWVDPPVMESGKPSDGTMEFNPLPRWWVTR